MCMCMCISIDRGCANQISSCYSLVNLHDTFSDGIMVMQVSTETSGHADNCAHNNLLLDSDSQIMARHPSLYLHCDMPLSVTNSITYIQSYIYATVLL